MLQIDHTYEFFYSSLFKNHFELISFFRGVPPPFENFNLNIFTPKKFDKNIIFYDQEPLLPEYTDQVLDRIIPTLHEDADITILVTTEHSDYKNQLLAKYNLHDLYYFFHGFAALDWYRGYYALNYDKQIVKNYTNDFISFNRIITGDRSYRIYLVSLLKEHGLLDQGLVSFNVTDGLFDDWHDEISNDKTRLSEHSRKHAERYLVGVDKLSIDGFELPGSASASIPRDIQSEMNPDLNTHKNVDSFWHIVTETAFYQSKLHLTEKIFKPIVSKQPFMLLAAPGNLEYLRSYGFKTFTGIIDESYDLIEDHDARVEAVVAQLKWYCSLTDSEKTDIQKQCEPIVEHNFHHFYGKFKEIITDELLDNTKKLFEDIGYDDSNVDYSIVRKLLIS